jgi:L-iditol 2-dehydrogenase
MQAMVLKSIGSFELEELPEPAAGTGEIIVKVEACAICGSDLRTYRHGHPLIQLPHLLGHEVSGTVAQVGKQVDEYQTGDRVAIAPGAPCRKCKYCYRGLQNLCENRIVMGTHFPGAFAQYLRVPAQSVSAGAVVKIPEHLSYEEATLGDPLVASINGQQIVNTSLGDQVVIMGAGPVGCLHIALAKLRGAAKTILMDVNDSRLDMAEPFSPSVLVNNQREDPISLVQRETDGMGADVVVVACTSAQAQEQAIRMAAKRGRILFFAGLPRDNPFARLDSNLIHYRELRIYGSFGSTILQYRQALRLLATGAIRGKDLISLVLPLRAMTQGLEAVERGDVLKAVLRPWND